MSPVKVLIYCHIIPIISIHNFPINSFYFLCIFPSASHDLYILHIVFPCANDFKSIFCLFCIIYFVLFSVHFLISLPIQAVQQPIRLNKTHFFLLSRHLIYLLCEIRKIRSKKPDITALLQYTRLSDSYDLSVISYSVKYSGYSSIFFWRSLRNRPRCPVIKSSASTSFGIPIIM